MSKQYNQRKSKPGNSNDGKKPGAMKKFHPLSSMNKPKFSFDTVLTSFLDHLLVLSSTNKNMNDMAESMKAGAMITLVRPTILVSSNTNPDLKATEDKAYAITMASQLKTFHAREEDLRQNQPFVKSLIMTKFVTQEMEDKLRNEVNFETTLQNPIELINRIEKFMKESYDGSYDVWNHFQQQQKLYSMRQMTGESAINWKKRLERQGKIVKEHAGDAMFRQKITTNKSLTDATSKTVMQDYLVRREGNEFIMLGTWSQYHHYYHYDIDSGEELQFPDWAAHDYEGQEVGAERYELADEAEEGEQYLHHREEERDAFGLYNKLLLDSGATHTTMCNPAMVHDICEASMTLGMSSNMESRMIDEECKVGTYPQHVYFDVDGKANVMSLSKMISQGNRITMDTDEANAFIVHCNNGKIMRFVESKGVYLWEDPEHPMRSDNTSLRARGGQTGGDNINDNQPVSFLLSEWYPDVGS